MKAHNNPLVSVVMSVHNGEKHLQTAILSILTQTYTRFEFLIMDDGSVDRSHEIIAHHAETDNRIKYFSQPNKGLHKSLNTLINHASGLYIIRMDADDISEQDRIEIQVEYLDSHPDSAFVVGGSLVINQNGNVLNGKFLTDDNDKLKQILFTGQKNPFTHGAIAFRKSCLDSLSMIYRFRYSQDFDLLLRLASIHKVGANECILYRFREGSSLQMDNDKTVQRLKQRRMLLEIMSQGKLFDDEYCIAQVAAIYQVSGNTVYMSVSNKAALERVCSFKHKRHLFSQGGSEIRRFTRICISEHGMKPVYIMLFLWSLMPQILIDILDNAYVTLHKIISGGTINWMTMSELNKIKRL